MKLIAGLGNPGREYEKTPHNVGFVALDQLCQALGGTWKLEKRFTAEIAKVSTQGDSLLLVKPMTFMNLSGESINKLMQYYRILPNHVIVLSDDINLSPGRIRIRETGGAGGHNGLKSIIAQLGTQAFTRIRIGVGQGQSASTGLVNHVLGHIAEEDAEAVNRGISDAADAARCILREGTPRAMNRYNTVEKAPEPPKAEVPETNSTLNSTPSA